MANFKRRRPRQSPGRAAKGTAWKRTQWHSYNWMCHWPAWWDRTFHTRKKRARNKALVRKVMKGADPDGVTFPLGNRKPHIYYW